MKVGVVPALSAPGRTLRLLGGPPFCAPSSRRRGRYFLWRLVARALRRRRFSEDSEDHEESDDAVKGLKTLLEPLSPPWLPFLVRGRSGCCMADRCIGADKSAELVVRSILFECTCDAEVTLEFDATKKDTDTNQDEDFYRAGQWQLVWWKFKRHRLANIGMIVLAVFYFFAIFAGFMAPYDPLHRFKDYVTMSPSKIHLWATERPFANKRLGVALCMCCAKNFSRDVDSVRPCPYLFRR